MAQALEQESTAKQQYIELQNQHSELQKQQNLLQAQHTKLTTLTSENNMLQTTGVGWAQSTFTWEVKNYKVPSDEYSPAFYVGGFKFRLNLDSEQPAQEEGRENYTGLFLQLRKGWKALVKMDLQIINSNDSNITASFSEESTFDRLKGVGAIKLLSNEALKGYLKDGMVTVRAIVSVKMPEDWASAQLLTK